MVLDMVQTIYVTRLNNMSYKSHRHQQGNSCDVSCLLYKFMQQKFCMACMELYMALGHGCQEESTQVGSKILDKQPG